MRGDRTGEKKEVQELGGQRTHREGGAASRTGQAEHASELVRVLFLTTLSSR